jgi:FAD-dependent oxidoreductase domain-containing protein 1
MRGRILGVRVASMSEVSTPERADVVIVGGGIIGSSIAYHLAHAGVGSVCVIERDPSYEFAATPRSNGGIRRLFSRAQNIRMASYGLTFYRDFAANMAVDDSPAEISFRRQGYLFVSDAGGAAQMETNFELQASMGVEVEALSPGALQTRFPSLAGADVDLAVLSGHDAWIDPHAALMGFRNKARALGVKYLNAEVVGFDHDDMAIRAAKTADGTRIAGDWFVNAGGAWCASLASMVGLELPVQPMSRESYFFRTAMTLEPLPFVKTETDLAIRPEGQGYVGGLPAWDEADGWNFEISPDYFVAHVWPALARRIPAMQTLKLERSWRGHYARSQLDLSPFIGRWAGGISNFVLANGFSGHGIMHAPATGRAIAELLGHGEFQSIDISCFDVRRVQLNEPFREVGIV